MLLTFAAYAAGAALAAAVTRGGVPDWWRHAIRLQIAAVAIVLSFASAWRLELGLVLVGIAVLVIAVGLVAVVAAVLDRRSGAGVVALDTWAAMPNTSFWAVPLAGALGGPGAATVAVLADRLIAIPTGVLVHLMRRDAPRPQRRSTSWVDQAPLLALVAGLGAKLVGEAPSWTATVLEVAGPVLAFSGAALWMGSVRLLLRSIEGSGLDIPAHDAGGGAGSDAGGGAGAVRRYLALSAARVVGCGAVVAVTWGSDLGLVAALWAGSIPTFGPALATTLYGYPAQVAAVAARWGWLAGPMGVGLALVAA